MTEVILDGKQIRDRAQLHEKLAAALDFPEWYGKNLDALYDCLSDIRMDTVIRLVDEDVLEEHLGDYAHRLYRVLTRAEEEIPWLYIVREGMRVQEI